MSNEKAINPIKKSYDKIYDTSVNITKAYNSEYIPLNTLYQLLQVSKMKKNKKIKDIVKNYNVTIDVLYTSCKSYCEKNNLGTRLPMSVLDVFINQLKSNL